VIHEEKRGQLGDYVLIIFSFFTLGANKKNARQVRGKKEELENRLREGSQPDALINRNQV